MKKRGKALTFPFFACLFLFLLSSCNTGTVKKLTWESRPPREGSAGIELFVGQVSRPCEEIAILQSKYYEDQSKENKTKMLADLRNLARRVGADAVMGICILPKRFQGMVADEKVPFPAWKPGTDYSYFMRGTAIVFKEDTVTTPTEKQ
ncbi:MAG: hypothetical protein NT106_00575 [Candidatus Sumerlaeota bacterium]|nr:hypothetical protein [Candidatus Sumerlaeota bacterium]